MMPILVKILILCLCLLLVEGRYPGPWYPPTKGEPWPKPQEMKRKSQLYILGPSFRIKVANYTCPLLEKAVQRYEKIYKHNPISVDYQLPTKNKLGSKLLNHLDNFEITLTGPCEDRPYLGMDEAYQLKVSQKSKLTSASVWGILRGLETFANLLFLSDDYKTIMVRYADIKDYPQYPYRGLMLDTARHYISVDSILMTLGAMAMNKMNIFHWHIVNSESFPYQSDKFPELSERGAFYKTLVYTKSDIQRIVEFARERGIIVIPDFPMPQHCISWQMSHPEINANCYETWGVLNPAKNETHNLLQSLFEEVQERFPSNHYYLGDINMNLNCWKENLETSQYMKKNKMTVDQVLAEFYQKVIAMHKKGTVPIVWQDWFERGFPISNETIVHVYRNDGMHDIVRVLQAGHLVIQSAMFVPIGDKDEFRKMYFDPRTQVRGELLQDDKLKNILGAEVGVWADKVDDANVITKVWSSASSLAEVMWSTTSTVLTGFRLPALREELTRAEEHVCRMLRRGLPVSPFAPGYCVY